ncbi:hypothetical protein BE15_47105 [Sorangium cellulosum]|uniref:Uncharacterized protein n=1 Tax=Sorangium cellulosum TaxID=56 RepID=A0A150QV14_SORCE|nr:hypothetical protein BE15_47105 [Sorangium cellulosum]
MAEALQRRAIRALDGPVARRRNPRSQRAASSSVVNSFRGADACDSARRKRPIALLTGEPTSSASAQRPFAASAPANYSRATRCTDFCALVSTRTGRGAPSASSIVALTTSYAKVRLMCTANAVARMIPSSSSRSIRADVTISRAFVMHPLPRIAACPAAIAQGLEPVGAPRHLHCSSRSYPR